MEQKQIEWKFLQHSADDSNANVSWAESFKEVGVIKTVNELNFAINKIKEIKLSSLNTVYFFREDIKPMWEDKVNVNGGRLIIEVTLNNPAKIEEIFNKTLMFSFLNVFPSILGAAYNEKENNARICLWISDAEEEKEIATAWKAVLAGKFVTINFISHNRNKDKGGYKKKSNQGIPPAEAFDMSNVSNAFEKKNNR